VRSNRRATIAFVALCAAGVAAVVVYALYTSRAAPPPAAGSPAGRYQSATAVPSRPFMIFRDASPGSSFGRIAVVSLPVAAGERLIAPLSCERVHYAAGAGVCMTTDESRLPVRYAADIFDGGFRRLHTIPLTGPPIRTRVSPDGRRAALTVFERGHSYADEHFSTRTILIETATGRRLGDLEEFGIDKDGQPFKSVDFNFWGVTFAADGDGFFATLKTHGQRYLIKGSVDARHASVLRDNVECPSLSPDGKLLVFKKPFAQGIGWQLYVLDLASGTEHPLNHAGRSVDDQVDWFDDSHVVYHDSAAEGTGIWVLSVDGAEGARLLVPNGYSPAVQR
jgi:hypothetical protein